jgi:hypothetical protein
LGVSRQLLERDVHDPALLAAAAIQAGRRPARATAMTRRLSPLHARCHAAVARHGIEMRTPPLNLAQLKPLQP